MAIGKRVSQRTVRQAVGDNIATINTQADVLKGLTADVGTVAAIVGDHARQLAGLPMPTTFWGRLRWLVKG